MKVIVFAKTKGGVAASTLCYNVALLAAEKSQVFLIDRDPQLSLKKMWEARNELINPRMIGDVENVARTARRYREAGFDRDYAFVDTPGSITPVINDALEAADLIVVPVQPGHLDLWGQDAVVGRIERLGLINKMMFVLTRVQPGSGGIAAADKARRYLQQSVHPIPVMPERIAFSNAAEKGLAAWEVSKGSKSSKDIKAEVEKIWKAMQVALKGAAVYSTEQSNVVPIERR